MKRSSTSPTTKCHRNTLSAAVMTLALTLGVVTLTTQQTNAAGLLVADGGFGGELEIKEHNVDVTINNGIAVTNVEQVFLNTESRIVEALYTFPVPKQASVANFSMWINGKEMIGEVVEKERAREIYESYKQTRKDPGLLEQVDFKRFEMRIFPIAAGAEQRVKITYYQELDIDHDWATYVYPLATTTRQSSQNDDTKSFSFRMDVKSEVPIVKMESPSHEQAMAITGFEEHLYRSSLEVSNTTLAEDVVVAYKVERPVTGIDLIANKERGEDGFFQATVTVGDELSSIEKGMDYVFVLDISGSMKNRNKLNLSQSSVYSFIESLSPEDRFEIITFNDMPTLHFGELVTATSEQYDKAQELLSTLRARGGTSLEPAIQSAYKFSDPDRSLNVVLLSDGLTSPGESSTLVRTIQSRPENCRVFAVGVGNDVNRPLLRSMAERAGGLAAFLSQNDNFERQAAAFRRKLTRPAIENVKLEFDSAVYDIEPLGIANIYHGSPLQIYGRYRNSPRINKLADQTVNVTLSGTIQGAPWEQTAELTLPGKEDSNPEIERMWASYRVDRLLPKAKANDRGAKNEVVSLCEQYSIVSEFASFIVLENDAEYRRWNIERRNADRSARDRKAQEQVNKEFRRLRDKAMAQLGPQDAAQPGNEQQADRVAKTPQSFSPNRAPQSRSPRRTARRNVSSPGSRGGGGGGAFDPITGLLALGLGGLGWTQRKKKQKENQ